jgi:phospholipase D1/2
MAREEGPVNNQIAKALVEWIIEAARDGHKFKVCNVLSYYCCCGYPWAPCVCPGYQELQRSEDYHGNHSTCEEIRVTGFESRVMMIIFLLLNVSGFIRL